MRVGRYGLLLSSGLMKGGKSRSGHVFLTRAIAGLGSWRGNRSERRQAA